VTLHAVVRLLRELSHTRMVVRECDNDQSMGKGEM